MLQNREKIEHEGIIYSVNPSHISVRITQKSACADCHAKSACSISDSKEKIIEIPDTSGKYKIGDSVIISGDSHIGLTAVLFAFVIPLAITVIVLILVLYFTKSEELSIGCAVLALICYFCVLYFLQEKLKNKFVFTLTKKL